MDDRAPIVSKLKFILESRSEIRQENGLIIYLVINQRIHDILLLESSLTQLRGHLNAIYTVKTRSPVTSVI